MRMNLQYFASQSSSDEQSASSVADSSSATSASSASAKYTQDDVNKMMATKAKVTSEAAERTFKAQMADSISNAVAHQKKIDNMNATELKQEQEKEHTAKLNSLIAENKQFKQSMADDKALHETNDALNNDKISHPDLIAPLLTDTDPEKRSNNITAFNKWLKSHDDALKTNLLKGHSEPQVGGNAAQVPTKPKKLSDMSPQDILYYQKNHPEVLKSLANNGQV